MNLCWKLGKATARQVHEASLSDKNRDYRTVKTMLDRIAAKGYLEIEKLGPLCLYRPAVSRKTARNSAIQEFFETVLDRSVAPLYLHLAEREDLTDEEIEFFRSQIETEDD
jgi:BlaI family penicillinase repressor